MNYLMKIRKSLKEEIHEIIEKTFVGVEQDIISLLKIIVENHRVNLLKDILVSFNSLCNSYKGITEGMLFSAFPYPSSVKILYASSLETILLSSGKSSSTNLSISLVKALTI